MSQFINAANKLLSAKLWGEAMIEAYKKGTKVSYIMRCSVHVQIVENLKPFALLGGVKIWQVSNDTEQESTIGMKRDGEQFWVMTDSTDENEIKSLLTRVAAGTPARSTRD